MPVAVRPKLTDPVLAYRESGTANVGELTTAFPPAWIGRADGRAAIRQWIEAVLPSVSSRRYTFQLTEQGHDVEIDIALAPEGNRLPQVDRIEASVEMPGAPALEVSVRRDEEAPATFRARLTLPPSDRPIDATLVLKESGPGALVRPQRIPMLVPPRQPLSGRRVAESFSFGLNEPLLRAMAKAGSGSYDAVERMTRRSPDRRRRPHRSLAARGGARLRRLSRSDPRAADPSRGGWTPVTRTGCSTSAPTT